MWSSQVLSLLTGIALAVLGARLSEGIGRRARLTRAGHELDVAKKFDDDHPLSIELRSRAEDRLAKYLAAEHPDSRRRRRWLWARVCIVVVLVGLLAALTALSDDNDEAWWSLVTIGLACGLVGESLASLLEPVIRRVLLAQVRRRVDGTPPAPPTAPTAAADRRAPADQAQPEPPPPAAPPPTPPT
jgi:hypothetical protein